MTSLTLDMDNSFHGCDQNLELKEASCSKKDLDTVPQNLSEDTEVLDLSENNITKLLNSSFEVYPLINSLDISFNDVRAIESAAFYPLKGLMYLFLAFNENLVLPATGVFMMSTQLSFLDLTSTYLKSLPIDTFKWIPHLDTAFLFYNRLSSINVSSCDMADNVIMIGNRLKHLTTRDFIFVCHTDILDIRGNRIQSVDPDVIASLHVHSLVLGGYPLSYEVLANIVLGISKSDIEQLTIEEGSVGAFPKGFFDPLRDSSLSVLDFNSNKLNSLHPLVFSNLTKVRQFSFSNNKLPIDEIQPDLFDGMNALKILAINDNRVRQINPNNQTWTVDLLEFDLSGNLCTEISASVFHGLGNLTFLDMSSNKHLSVFELTAFSGLDHIQTIDLTGSRVTVLELNTPILRSLSLNSLHKENTICSSASLDPLREKPLLDFDPNELCIMNYGLFSLIPLASISLIVISVLVYHYRWQLRYKLFLLKLAAVGYREMLDARDPIDYEFDVTIIFYDDDEEWIREQLRPALGERLPQFQRNVFGDEDLVLGMHYLDSVDYVVSHSYKTIIVLSRAAVHDHWFILKFRTAMDHVSDTLTEFVVVVFLEDIPDDEMPFLARLYLSDGRPYIHWTENVRGQEYFWDELTKNLTINLRTNDLIPNE
ncbi:leucine-rich repeat-containing G-protein coupled receptor 4-like [Strongylocentrotus purpuratus]|uniref:TIR domain-containing protein n=1 Tax=Strongylocentrotus purpuratus TaxID=7668 RepID=A0A7M7SYK0_STRPU|nr:leucine-rich repeat-containing G-protein coupled receptor 4-like [Strongylocentrotus purpuratus]